MSRKPDSIIWQNISDQRDARLESCAIDINFLQKLKSKITINNIYFHKHLCQVQKNELKNELLVHYFWLESMDKKLHRQIICSIEWSTSNRSVTKNENYQIVNTTSFPILDYLKNCLESSARHWMRSKN